MALCDPITYQPWQVTATNTRATANSEPSSPSVISKDLLKESKNHPPNSLPIHSFAHTVKPPQPQVSRIKGHNISNISFCKIPGVLYGTHSLIVYLPV